jgi:hypothetical protein
VILGQDHLDDSIVAGVFAGLLLGALLLPPLAVPTVVGIAAFVISVRLHQWCNRARWIAMNRSVSVLFPSRSESGQDALI